ncbi:MAG: YggS family pyridoxal phosphate-dependent enzyme [Gaiellales bacterium]|mgnify:FL=1|nr:YggS family pyridoxal phosphate-dependent enzyme [Gaiellales bacterium]
MTLSLEKVRSNLVEVHRRIKAAQARGGRLHQVGVVAATKYVLPESMGVVRDAGIRMVGENRAKELQEKWGRFRNDFEFHFIGHVQHRKVGEVVPCVSLIHSVDSLRLVKALNERSGEGGIDVLLQVNVSGEESKYGIVPAEAAAFLEEALVYERVRFRGLMTMAPLADVAEETRPVFRGLRELRDNLAPRFAGRYQLSHLSMGMTNDFEVAVEEGATLVRLGSVLFSSGEGG